MLFEDDRGETHGEASSALEQPVLSLVSLNARTASSVDILRGQLTVLSEIPDSSQVVRSVRISCGREPGNTIVLKDSRVSLHHFTVRVRAMVGGRVVLDLLDQSSNGTWVDGKRVGRGHRVTLSVGQRIVALPASLVGRSGEVGYVLLHDTKGARCNPTLPEKAKGDLQVMPERRPGPKGLPRELEEDLRCGICTDVLHRCLTIVPCGHNFCAICLAKWRKRSTVCPGCRGPVRQAVQNLDVDRVAETFLRAHPESGRSPEELAALDRAACEPESAAHLRWLLREPPHTTSSSGSAPVASPQRHGVRQRPQSATAASAVRQHAAGGPQRPQSAQVSRRSEQRPHSSACIIC